MDGSMLSPKSMRALGYELVDSVSVTATQEGSSEGGPSQVELMRLAAKIRGGGYGLSFRENCEVAADILGEAIRQAKHEAWEECCEAIKADAHLHPSPYGPPKEPDLDEEWEFAKSAAKRLSESVGGFRAHTMFEDALRKVNS